MPEEYKRRAERNMAAATPSILETKNSKEKFNSKKAIKSHSLAEMVRVDDSIKNDLKLKAEVKVHVNKGGVHKNFDPQKAATHGQMITESLVRISYVVMFFLFTLDYGNIQ